MWEEGEREEGSEGEREGCGKKGKGKKEVRERGRDVGRRGKGRRK